MKRVTWTDIDPKIKTGSRIQFKDEIGFWDILLVFPTQIEKKEINRTWHVGGL
jgi:hypothetical protein